MNTLIGVGLAARKQIELLDLGRTVGEPLGRTEPRAHPVAVELVALVHLVAVRRIDRLVIGVVERLLVHVEPDQRSFRARLLRPRGTAGDGGAACCR